VHHGIAQRAFIEKKNEGVSSPFRSVFPSLPSWSYISRCVDSGMLLYVDYAAAQTLLSSYPHVEEDVALFLSFLMCAAREGHVCVRVQETMVAPDPAILMAATQCFGEEEGEAFSEEEKVKMRQRIIRGAALLPEGLVEGCDSSTEHPSHFICRWGEMYYLQRNWLYETHLLEHIRRIVRTPPEHCLDGGKVREYVEKLVAEERLLPEQAAAVECACEKSIALLVGGPGTGKTYTAGYIIKLLVEETRVDGGHPLSIAVASSTGKAAINVQASLMKAFADEENPPHIMARTLHSLLGLRQYRREARHHENNPLPYDVILVDESSMIDLCLMTQLCSAVKKGARIIFLGDRDQLAPVEIGSVFSDILRLFQNDEKLSACCALFSRCMRANLKEIVSFAHYVNDSDENNVLEALASESTVVRRVSFEKKKHLFYRQMRTYCDRRFPRVDADMPPKEMLQAFNTFRMLSPLRQGVWGVDTLNSFLEEYFRKKTPYNTPFIAPIMIVKNSYRLELCNGEVGVMVTYPQRERSYALFPGYAPSQPFYDEEHQVRRFPVVMLPAYEYAYCLSVHKSQGSEFNSVLVFLPEGSDVFGKEVLYTAVTRAREAVEICGDDATLSRILNHSSQRISGIVGRSMVLVEAPLL
jgi:exodeoxyribonuclease V alpha subunit